MVHLRLNENETNPNPHVNFITALQSNAEDREDARQLLRALAAQYEFNQVFAGRNWNNGETVELVLRRPGGSFYPTYWLMSTLCHELAHIKHMNHGPAFQALWKRLRADVRKLQDRGYYGDGYWSSGTRLSDSARIGGEGINAGDLPEYMCGGAQSRTRPTATRRRRATQGKRRDTVPSLHTGRQTAIKRKAGARVTSKYAFAGEGSALANDDAKGKGFGKQAASKRAREERALATERRLRALQGLQEPETSTSKPADSPTEDESSDGEIEFVPETDMERREALLASEPDINVQEKLGSGNSWEDFEQDFNFNNRNEDSGSKSAIDDIIELSSDEDDDAQACDVPVASGSTFTSGHIGKDKGKGKANPWSSLPAKQPGVSSVMTSSPNPKSSILKPLGIGNLVQTEVDLRKKESLGMAPTKSGGRTLGSRPNETELPILHESPLASATWSCLVCTLENEDGHLSCSACATPRGDKTWFQGP
ncbi:WLM domain-containing protein [Crassisporium funariophilum]|nr:WLM domain-containing protein [Crassisporium funariophilum]